MTNLRITKRVTPSDIVAGQAALYTVVVTNTSNVTARSVVANELEPPSGHFIRIRAPKGVRCRGTRPLRCVIGELAPHKRVVLRATDNQAHAVLRVHTVSPAACAATRARC